MKQKSRLWLYLPVSVLVLLSFFHFSFYYSPLLNSDSALGILLANYVEFPQELYCWGQDRGGNFVPLLGRLLSSFTPLPLIVSLSFIHFFILILGYCSFATFIKNDLLKIALASFWLLPPWQFVEFLLYPYGIQYSIFGIILYLAAKLKSESPHSNTTTILLAAVSLLAILGIWVSDFLLVSFIALLVVAASGQNKTYFLNSKILIWLVLTTILGVVCITYAKLQSVPSANYSSFAINNFSEVGQALKLTWASIARIFTFQSESFFQSIFWIFIVLSIFPFIGQFKKGLASKNERASEFLWKGMLVNSLLTTIALFTFHWVLTNEMGRRYFSCLFISVILTAIFFLDVRFPARQWQKIAIIAIAAISLLSALENFYFPVTKKAKIEYIREINKLEPAGIIGNYWNSYVYSSLSPANILTTPHDNSVYRNIKLVEKALSQPNLYLVKDMWLTEFPDTIRQFGRYLIKSGQSFHLGDSDFCRYRVGDHFYNFTYRAFIPSSLLLKTKGRRNLLDATKLQFNGYTVFDSLSVLKQTIQLASFQDATHTISVSAKLNMVKGKYKARLNLRLSDHAIYATNSVLLCTIKGQSETYIIKNIERPDLKPDEYTEVKIEINIEQPHDSIRIELNDCQSSGVMCDYIMVEHL